VLGIPLTAVSLVRSRALHRTAAALLVAFLAIDVPGRAQGSPRRRALPMSSR
jgi:hypothetical protein